MEVHGAADAHAETRGTVRAGTLGTTDERGGDRAQLARGGEEDSGTLIQDVAGMAAVRRIRTVEPNLASPAEKAAVACDADMSCFDLWVKGACVVWHCTDRSLFDAGKFIQ